jgi:ankyrin repeat protein
MTSITGIEVKGFIPLDKRQVEKSFPKCNLEALSRIFSQVQCIPVTLSNRDLEGRTLQLWNYKNVLHGTVLDKNGNIRLISGRKIRNPCRPDEESFRLLQRLENAGLCQWHLGYSSRTGEIYVFPFLKAAGKDPDYVPKQINDIRNSIPGLRKHFKREDLKGARTELSGKVAAWKKITHPILGDKYRPFQHYKEVQDAQAGCTRLLRRLDRLVARKNITQEQKNEIKALHLEISNMRGASYKFAPPGKAPPSGFAFREQLQLNHLTGSYNASHPKHPVPERGGSGGSIGGVGNEVGIIEGLFDTAQGLGEVLHDFYIPSVDGKPPFSEEELQQILRELAEGIYVHDTVPFFSLHFNSDAHLYPVIHPVYENTLVGKVISLLDYYMKGFLNGAIFDTSAIQTWNEGTSVSFLKYPYLDSLPAIDVNTACKNLGAEYLSLREMIDHLKRNISALQSVAQGGREVLEGLLGHFGQASNILLDDFLDKPDPAIFSDYSGFRSSFRIIAKQNSIKKLQHVFELDGDFDVFYTIEPDPAYGEALSKYRYEHGCEPPGYLRLEYAYELMGQQIKTLMPKIPIFRDLFEQLKVINFFCYYLKTLKKAQKCPILTKKEMRTSSGCFSLFPHLPIRKTKIEKIELDFETIFRTMPLNSRVEIANYFLLPESNEEPSSEIILSFLKYAGPCIRAKFFGHPLLQNEEFIDLQMAPLKKFFKDQRRLLQRLKNKPLSNLELSQYKVKKYSEPDTCNKEILARFYLSKKKDLKELRHAEKKFLQTVETIKIELAGLKLEPKNDQWVKQDAERRLIQAMNEVDYFQSQIDGPEGYDGFRKFLYPVKIPFTVPMSAVDFGRIEDENKRIVGGCGQNLSHLAVTQSSMETSQFSQLTSRLSGKKDEEFIPVVVNEGSQAKGHAFRLHIMDFPAVSDKDYQGIFSLSLEAEGEDIKRKREFLNAILFEDEEYFLKLLPSFKTQNVEIQGVHAIHYAAAAKSPLFLKELIAAGHAVDVVDSHGYLPYHYAAKEGRVDRHHFLYVRSSTIDHPNHNGITPLHLAVLHQKAESVDYLLSMYACPNTQTNYGMTPLFSAVLNGNEAIALKLIHDNRTKVDLGVEDKRTPLFVAVECNMPVVVEALLKRGANCCVRRIDTYTPLHVAAKKGLLEICLKLIAAGADVDVQLKSGKTPLHLAAEGYPEVVEALLQHKADPSLAGWDGMTPLMAAIVSGDTLSAEKIIRFCAQTDQFKKVLVRQDLKGETPLFAAIARKQYRIADSLLKLGIPLAYTPEVFAMLCRARVSSELIAPILAVANLSPQEIHAVCLIAQELGHNEFVSYMVLFNGVKDKNVPRKPNGWGLIHYAAQHDHIDVIKRFIKTSEDLICLTKDGKSVAAIAAEHNSCRSLKLLVQAMIDKYVPLEKQWNGKHLLAAAVASGNIEAADVIIHKVFDANLPIDSSKSCAAHLAARNDDVEMLNFLRSRGARFDINDIYGKTPIHVALELQHTDTIDYFLDQKLELKLPKDLLHYAAQKGSAAQIDGLIKRGFQVNGLDTQGQTALNLAISADNFPVFEMLCKHGADPSCQSKEGFTPFLQAARLGRVKFMVPFLATQKVLEKGPNGESALHLAVQGGHEECVSLLLHSGFKPNMPQNDGTTPFDLAKNLGFSHILFLLEGKGELLRNLKEQVVQAIQKGEMDLEEFKKLVCKMPLNQPMIFEVKGQSKNIPLLHLIHEEASSELWRAQLIQIFDQLPGADCHVKCVQGKKIAHIQAKKGEDISPEDLCVADVEGCTPLHLYATHATPQKLESFLKSLKRKVDLEDAHGLTPLFMAICSKRLDNTRILLEKGADPNHLTAKLMTPLSAAIHAGQMEVVKLLLKLGAYINKRCLTAQSSPLMQAIGQSEMNIVRLLIIEGADVNLSDRHGMAPVHAAALSGNLPLLRLLQNAGANFQAEDNQGMTVMHFAAQSDNPDLIDFLVDHGVSLTKPSQLKRKSLNDKQTLPQKTTPFHLAARRGNESMCAKLIQKGCDVKSKNEYGLSALAYAAQSENKQAIRLLKPYKLIKDSEERAEAIQMALVMDSLSALKEFYRDHSPVNSLIDKQARTALHYAASFGAYQCAIFLMQQGGDLTIRDRDHKTPFDLAVQGKHLTLIRYFVQELGTIDLDAKGTNGKSYLVQACESGCVELAALLIELGASIESVDAYGMKPIHIASRQSNYALLHLLLSCGADCNAKTADGVLAQDLSSNPQIRLLIEKYSKDQNQRLLSKGSPIHTAVALNEQAHFGLLCKIVNLNTRDSKGYTPLHRAALEGNLTMVCQLIQHGAGIDEKDSDGLTALQLAILSTNHPQKFAIIEFLVNANANVTVKDKKGNSPLHLLMQFPNEASVHHLFTLILERIPKKVRTEPSHEMCQAIQKGDIGAFLSQINEGHPLNMFYRSTLLHAAVRDLNFPILHCLLDWFVPHSISIDRQDASGTTALHLAVQKNNYRAVQALVEKGANLDLCSMNEGTPLKLAFENNVEIASYLLMKGAKPIVENHFPILQIISNGNCTSKELEKFNIIYKSLPLKSLTAISLEMKLAITKDNIDLFFAQMNEGHPLLEGKLFLYAASVGAVEILKRLHLWFDAKLETEDEKGCTPLHLAVKHKQKKAVEYLLDAKANPKTISKHGHTILYSLVCSKAPINFIDEKSIFESIYNKITKNSKQLGDLHNIVDDKKCFLFLNEGYSINEVCLIAARGDCVFTVKTLFKLFPKDHIDLEKVASVAKSAKANAVLQYIEEISPGKCIIL